MKKALYAFSGDPVTYGHLDIIERAAGIFDEVVVGIGVNPAKKYLFTLEERAAMAARATARIGNVRVVAFRGLLVDYAYEHRIPVIIRGLRNTEDFSFELMLHQIGESQKMHIDTFFLPTRQELAHISSGAAKALQIEQGLIHEYVPLNVKQKLEERLSGQWIVGVTGVIGAGKSYVSSRLLEAGRKAGIEVHRLDLDIIGHELLGSLQEPLFVNLRQSIAEQFGTHLLKEDGFIRTKELGRIIFSNREKLQELNKLLYKPLLLRLRRELYGKRGIILLESALIAESEMAYLCNNNCILVDSPGEEQMKRLMKRGYTSEQLKGKLDSQYTREMKEAFLKKEIERTGHGQVFFLNNQEKDSEKCIAELAEQLFHTLRPVVAAGNVSHP